MSKKEEYGVVAWTVICLIVSALVVFFGMDSSDEEPASSQVERIKQ